MGGLSHLGWLDLWQNSFESVATAYYNETEITGMCVSIYHFYEQLLAAGKTCWKVLLSEMDMAPPSAHSSIQSCSSSIDALFLPEAFSLLYSEHELLFQLLIALVRREVQTIKAAWRGDSNSISHSNMTISMFKNKNKNRRDKVLQIINTLHSYMRLAFLHCPVVFKTCIRLLMGVLLLH